MAWRATAVVALVGALAVVSGCTPDDEPSEPPTSGSSSTEETTEPETTPVETPPEVEAPTPAPEASTDDHVGAIWAARYFLDLYAYMRTTGDTRQFDAVSGDRCEFCANSSDAATELHEAGGWIDGGDMVFDIEAATAEYPTTEEPNYLVRFAMTQQPMTVHEGDGTTSENDAVEYQVVMALSYVSGRFIVEGVNSERS